MSSNIFTGLTENCVYELGNLLLEAAYCDGWTLIVVTPSGGHVTRQHGALVAYQLRDDGLWDSVHDCYSPRLPRGQRWCFAHGDAVKIDTKQLTVVADRRTTVQDNFREQQIERQFREIMATMEW